MSNEAPPQPAGFVPVFGSPHVLADMRGTTLVYPCSSAGMSPMIGTDLYILNEGATKIGYLTSEFISPAVLNDQQTVAGGGLGALTMPCELYLSADKKYTILQMRSGICGGKMKQFGLQFGLFVAMAGFTNIIVLSSTASPVKRGRESNRDFPEIYAYVNNHLHTTTIEQQKTTFYELHNIKKFGHWLEGTKKKSDGELREIAGGGHAKKLL